MRDRDDVIGEDATTPYRTLGDGEYRILPLLSVLGERDLFPQ